jgi:hypothetical protein
MGFLGLYSFAPGQSRNPAAATVQRVDILNRGNNFELEIQTSQPVTPMTQVVTGPDRLVIDFPNAVPGLRLHPIAVNAPHVKGVRMGLFAANPPVARVVVDLNSPQAYQIFPSGKSVIVKIMSAENATAALHPVSAALPVGASNSPTLPPPEAKPPPTLQVEFAYGKLRVSTERSTLGEVLRAIGQQTGASVSMPPDADRQPIVANLGPAPAREVIAALLSGVPYNVVLIGSGDNLSQVTRIMLTPRSAVTGSMPATAEPAPVQEAPPEPPPIIETEPPPQDTVPPPPQ